MSLETYVELFELRMRGILAAAFQMSGKTPTQDEWRMLRGEREITTRDMGEAGCRLGVIWSFEIRGDSPSQPDTTI